MNHKLIPIRITEEGELWLALCIVSLSISKNKKLAIAKNIKDRKQFIYCNNSKSWIQSALPQLTEKEKEVLQLACQGYTNQQIAEKISLNINTVKFHKRNIFEKLNTTNCTESILKASHWGLL